MTNQHSQPHGGILVNRLVSEQKDIKNLLNQSTKTLQITRWTVSDLEMIATGAFSPLEGFMGKADYDQVLSHMRLKDGTVWPVPITLTITENEADSLHIGDIISLVYEGVVYGVLKLQDMYNIDKLHEARAVFGTTDNSHPGVKKVLTRGTVNLSGPIYLFQLPSHGDADSYYYTPQETRQLFKKLGWKTIVGFQTRNPVHRAHEYIQKCALEMVDGLFLHPLVGETKSDDISAHVRLQAYKAILDHYYPKNRVALGVYPGAMRYAGPREAILHALVRKNYGCTHFIVGRDHAGVGNFYATYEAQDIFDQFSQEDIGITIMKFENSFYCSKCQSMATAKTCPHDDSDHITLSGTKVRKLLKEGIRPPEEYSRPEVIEILIRSIQSESNEP